MAAAAFALVVAAVAGAAAAEMRVGVGERVPAAVLALELEVCNSNAGVSTVSLGALSAPMTVVAHYYVGCTPGRSDSPMYTQTAALIEALYPGEVSFLTTLKNGVNNATCEAWATQPGSATSTRWPYVVNDEHRALVYPLFDAQVHPSYVVLDHCHRVHAQLGSIASATNALREAVESARTLLSEPCPDAEGDAAPEPEPEPVPDPVPEPTQTCVPQFGQARELRVLPPNDDVHRPRDVKFHPVTGALWVASNDTDSLVMLTWPQDAHPAEAQVDSQARVDRAHYHYMDRISALSFDASGNGRFATCQESLNTYDDRKRANLFMGPSLYETVYSGEGNPIFVDQKGLPCDLDDPAPDKTCFFIHSDMLHASPLCMGITHDPTPPAPHGNVYWEFDGLAGMLIRYDFEQMHGPGSLDHSLASVRRFPEVNLTRVPGVPGHMVVDASSAVLYIADSGAHRILAVNTLSGRFEKHARADLGGEYESWSSDAASFEYSVYGCAEHSVLATLSSAPSGVALAGDALLVSLPAEGVLVALHKATGEELARVELGAAGVGVLGLTLEPHAEHPRVWLANGEQNYVAYLDVTEPCAEGAGVPARAPLAFAEQACAAPAQADLGLAVVHLEHDAGYLNDTMLGPAYGTSDACSRCDPACDNDMLLMSGYLCHVCLPDNCRYGVRHGSHGSCRNLIGQGYECVCDDGFTGDHCHLAVGWDAADHDDDTHTEHTHNETQTETDAPSEEAEAETEEDDESNSSRLLPLAAALAAAALGTAH